MKRRAAQMAKRDVPGLRVAFVGEAIGDGTELANVYRVIQERGLSTWVSILGYAADVRPLISAADALVLCSNREPLGRCVVEAMALEVPVIISECGGAIDFVEHEVSGLHFATGSVEQLAQCIVRLASDEETRMRFAREGRRIAEERLDSRRLAGEVVEVYRSLLSSATSRQEIGDMEIGRSGT